MLITLQIFSTAANLYLPYVNGDIIEQGTHDELLAASGHYHDLYHAQFTAPIA